MYNFAEFGVDYKILTLKNGVEVRFLKKKGLPIYIQAYFEAGSRFNEVAGQAHFCEHLLVAGTEKYKTKADLAEVLEKEGGYFEAFTSQDELTFNLAVPRKSGVPLALSVLKEVLTKSLFLEKAFENERQAILSEIENSLQDKIKELDYKLIKRFYPDYDLFLNTLGTKADIEKMQLKNITDFAEKNLIKEKLTFIIAGDVDEDEIMEELNEIELRSGEKTKTPELKPTLAEERQKELIFAETKKENSGFLLGFRCDTKNTKEVVGLSLMQQLFLGRKNPFIEELRYKRGLIYGGGVPLWQFKNTSFFGFRTLIKTEKREEVLEVATNILNKIYKEGINENELKVMKIKMDSDYRFLLQSAKNWVIEEGFWLRIREGEEMGGTLSVLEKASAFSSEEITELYRQFLNPEKMLVEALGV